MLTPRSRSALRIRRIGGKLRKLCIISMQKADFPILRVKTDFAICKISEKLNQFSFSLEQLQQGSRDTRSDRYCCIGGHIFMTPTKNDQLCDPPLPHLIRKNEQ